MNVQTIITGKRTPKSPKPVDVKVGANVRALRNSRGISQETLGEALGVTFQQVQKMEKGTNRIGSSRLAEISAFFGVSILDLFKGISTANNSVEASEPVDQRIHKATRVFKAIPSEKMDHALKVLATFTD